MSFIRPEARAAIDAARLDNFFTIAGSIENAVEILKAERST